MTKCGSVRVVCFSSIENELDDYLATHIPKEFMSYEEIGEAYRQRWAIEVLWKFLKMHLKLDKMMSKNLHRITVQIYVILIFHLILQLLKVLQMYASKSVDKLRYIQIGIRQKRNFADWLHQVVPCLKFCRRIQHSWIAIYLQTSIKSSNLSTKILSNNLLFLVFVPHVLQQ
jgi:hypothetical protein